MCMLVKRLFYGVRGSSHFYDDAVKWAYMLTEKAKHKAKVLVFWEKHGLEATTQSKVNSLTSISIYLSILKNSIRN